MLNCAKDKCVELIERLKNDEIVAYPEENIQYQNDIKKIPVGFKRNYYFVTLNNESDPLEVVRKVVGNPLAEAYTIRDYAVFNNYKDEDTIVINIHDALNETVTNLIFAFLMSDKAYHYESFDM